jgi:hypothetical protein
VTTDLNRPIAASVKPIGAKGKTTTDAPKKPVVPKEPAATPEMIEAVFAVLHLEGWQPKHQSPFSKLPMPQLKPNIKPPTRAQVRAAWELAGQMGWTPLNEDEKGMILRLRRATYKGRNIAADLITTIARTYPWVDGDPRNTEV